jgi:hypothetical protein
MLKNWIAIACVVLLPGVLGCNKDVGSPTAPTATNLVPAASSLAPAGSIVMQGTVFDTAYRPLPRARIEVLDGPQAGLTAIAGARGGFSMSGLFDETTRFQATVDGHITSTRTLQPFCARCNPNWWINFELEVPEPSVNIAGDYTMTFTANNTCTMLPSEMRSRTFTATIPATSPALPALSFFQVGGATLFEDWDAISIGVAGGYVAFWLETLVEQIAPNTFVAFAGEAAADIDPSNLSTIELPFHGLIEYCVTSATPGRYRDCFQGGANLQRCNSSHQLTLTRR